MFTIDEECKELIKKINFNCLKNKSVLVTGASGLVGTYLISCLKQVKEELNLSISAWIKSDIDLEFESLFKDCLIIKRDITDINSFSDLPNYDLIIHAAGYGQPGKFMDNTTKTISLNTFSTIQLFEKLNKSGTFLFMSTSELYSGLENELINESQIGTTNTDHPRACYIEGKRCGEAICYSYASKGFNVKIARLSLAYGPGTKTNDQRVLNSLIQKGLTMESINLMDSGSAIRTYCYITDVIEMLWNIILFSKHTLYNVGGVSKISILELAKLIGYNLNKPIVTPKISNELAGNPKIVNISLDRYVNEFKKTKFIKLEDGLKKTINWQKKLYLK